MNQKSQTCFDPQKFLIRKKICFWTTIATLAVLLIGTLSNQQLKIIKSKMIEPHSRHQKRTQSATAGLSSSTKQQTTSDRRHGASSSSLYYSADAAAIHHQPWGIFSVDVRALAMCRILCGAFSLMDILWRITYAFAAFHTDTGIVPAEVSPNHAPIHKVFCFLF